MKGLLPGLRFVRDNNLSPEEVEILILLMASHDDCRGIAKRLNKNVFTVSSIMMTLRHKRVIVLKETKENRRIYQINSKNRRGTKNETE